MAKILDWKSSDDTRDIVHLIVQSLVEGKLVVLPAETAYHVFVSGLNAEAVEGLIALAEAGKVRGPSIFLRAPQEALDYSPNMSPVAARAVGRGWPGPLVLELPTQSDSSLANQLPKRLKEFLVGQHSFLAQRLAAHDAIREAMRLMPGPLVAAPIVQAGAASLASDSNSRTNGDAVASVEAVCTGKDAHRVLGELVSLVVDDGRTHFGGLATSVRVDENKCTLLNPGVVEPTKLDQMFQLIILLVCTGNTCRSPMAEAILRDLLAKQYPDKMSGPRPAAFVASAGLNAFPGGTASPEAQSVMRKRGLSLQQHQSRSVTERFLCHADFVLTMTNSHRAAILDKMPELEPKVQLLSPSGQDVSDPFGGSESVYESCADQITEHLQRWVSRCDDQLFPEWLFPESHGPAELTT